MKLKQPSIASKMVDSITASLRSTLKQQGLEQAREQWLVLNTTMSCEEWWPAVARAVRQLFDDYADEQQRLQTVRQDKKSTTITYVVNNNSQTEHKSWSPQIETVEQMVGMAEKGTRIIHTDFRRTK